MSGEAHTRSVRDASEEPARRQNTPPSGASSQGAKASSTTERTDIVRAERETLRTEIEIETLKA